MLEHPPSAGSSEAGLHLVVNHYDIITLAKFLKCPGISHRQKIRPSALIRFGNDSGDFFIFDSSLPLVQTFQEKAERSVNILKPVRERHLDESIAFVRY